VTARERIRMRNAKKEEVREVQEEKTGASSG
jgi:hypothetical protein